MDSKKYIGMDSRPAREVSGVFWVTRLTPIS
jgi:hypothetical protein